MVYKTSEVRKQELLEVAIKLANEGNYLTLTRQDIAREADVSPSLVPHYFGTMDNLREAIIREAIKRKLARIIAHGLANQNPLVRQAPVETRRLAAEYWTGKI